MFPATGVNYRMMPDVFDQLISGESCDEIADGEDEFGRSPLNPIPVNGILGEIKYLARLRCDCGNGLLFHRLGSFKRKKTGVDVYEIVCLAGKHWDILYLDFYHPRRSRKLPLGYRSLPYNAKYTKLAYAFGTNKRTKQFPHDLHSHVEKHHTKSLGQKCAEIVKAANFDRPEQHLYKLGEAKRLIDGVDASSSL